MIKKTNQGFTLIELLVVIAIIGLVSSVISASLASARSKARDTKRVAEMRSIEKALAIYAVNHSGYVPDSSWHSVADADVNGNNAIECSGANKTNNDQLFALLVADKALASAPSADAMAAKGYCYVYITDAGVSGIAGISQMNMIAGAVYGVDGAQYVGRPILLAATATTKSRNATVGVLSENTKTLSGQNAFIGVTYGPGTTGVQLNIDLTAGTTYNTSPTFLEGSN